MEATTCIICGKNPGIGEICLNCGFPIDFFSRYEIESFDIDGARLIRDKEYGYLIEYEINNTFTGYLDGNKVFTLEPNKSLKIYPGDNYSSKVLSGSCIETTPVQISDLTTNMTIKDNNSHTRYTLSDGKIIKAENLDGSIVALLDNKIHYLKPDGTYETLNSKGTYSIDEDGNIICKNEYNYTFYYSSNGSLIKGIDTNGKITNYSNLSVSRNINGNTRFSKMNYIEYDDEAYDRVLKLLNEINETVPNIINSSIDEIENTVNFFPDSYSNNNISTTKRDINDHIYLIGKLSETTNYSLLAYQGCDSSMIDKINFLIKDLFSDNRDLYLELMKEELKNSIENRNGILEYKEDASFKTDVEIDLVVDLCDLLNNSFDPTLFGMTVLDIYNDTKEVSRLYGKGVAKDMIKGLSNCPSNYTDYSFNPTSLIHGEYYYSFDPKTINNYQTNSEIITIKGYDIEFAQVLPKDCPATLKLAYNINKANVINTLKTLPDEYVKVATEKSNVIVLTCDKNAQTYKKDFAGYYSPSSGIIVIDSYGSFYSNVYYTRDAIIHEMGHKFDDYLETDKGSDYDLSNNPEWVSFYGKYKGIIPPLVDGSYTESGFASAGDPYTEFFAECVVAYFILSPDEFRPLCPEVYEAISNYLGGDYGGAYTNNIGIVLSPNYE